MRNSKKLVLVIGIACLTLATLALRASAPSEQTLRSDQQQGQSTQSGANQNRAAPGQQPTPDFSKNTWHIPPDADQTKNPVAATEESIAKGKEMYLTRKGNCVFCHGETGAGNEANLPKLRRKPADLSDSARMPQLSDGELYWHITK